MFEPLLHPPSDDTAVGWIVHVRHSEILLRFGSELPGTRLGDLGHSHHIGVLHGQSVLAVDVTEIAADIADDDHQWLDLRAAYGPLDEQLWVLAGRAVQIATWDRDHRFCGRCATATVSEPTERARRCPSCGLLAYPRLSPAVIMLVERDDTVLLAHGTRFPRPFYSALAGFVEPGETLENAVAREVKEEVGIDISDITYFGSQPWPFPHQIMIGFTAQYAGGDLVLDPEEIVDADWFRADDLPMVPPRGMSIAGDLLADWIDRVHNRV